MTNETEKAGWIVRVRTERLGGGDPLTMFYSAAYSDPRDAEEAVRRARNLASNESIEAVGELSRGTRDALGLAPGAVRVL